MFVREFKSRKLSSIYSRREFDNRVINNHLNWTKHMTRFMTHDLLLNVWVLCHDYTAKTLNLFMSNININDKWLIELQNHVFDSISYDDDVFNVVVLTSKLYFDVYFKNTFWIFRLTKFDKQFVINYENMKFVWNWATMNQTHTK